MAILRTGDENFACDVCGEVLFSEDEANLHKCDKKDSDNIGNPELLLTQQWQIEALLDDIEASEKALDGLIDLYSEAKAELASFLAENFDKAQAGTKKSAGMDVFLLWAANKAGLSDKYKTYISLSKKAEIHSKILESKGRRLSGLQTKIKLNDWRKR